ncbi:winged helix-turn-helix domain-containing protein [Gemmatimonadota bacterium]
MLITQEVLKGVEKGTITLAFRRWRRPTVKADGTLITAIGQLAIEAVDIVSLDEITESEAIAAGLSGLDSLHTQLLRRTEGDIYRIRMRFAGPDPRIALREEIPDQAATEQILNRLVRLDDHTGPDIWTTRILNLIKERPGENSADLARESGIERAVLKARIRRLKELGLTISLKEGYQLSPRGESVLRSLEDRAD